MTPRWTLIDNGGDLADFEFPVNPSEEDDFGKRRNVDHGGLTGDTGFVRQQSDDSPLILRCTGVIFHESMHAALVQWFAKSKNQTLDLIDHVGDRYEVIMTEYIPARKRTVRNPRDPQNATYHYWRYSMTFEIITVKSGPWVGVG